MKQQKKKMSLAMQIFIALILAILVGLLIQSHADFVHQAIRYDLSESCEIYRRSDRPVFDHVRYYFHERYQKSRRDWTENGMLLSLYDRICRYRRTDWRKSVQGSVSGRCDN